MRLRLFERLGRLVGWRPGWQGDGGGRQRETPGPTERMQVAGTGRNTGAGHRAAAAPAAVPAPPQAAGSGPPAVQPPGRAPEAVAAGRAGGPRAAEPAAGRSRPAAAAEELLACERRPAVPAASAGRGSGRRRSSGPPRWRRPPADRTARSQPPAAPPRQPWYQVVGESGGRRPSRACRVRRRRPRRARRPRRGRRRPRCSAGRPRGPASRAIRPEEALPFAAPHPRGHPRPPTAVGTAVRSSPSCGGSGTPPRPLRPPRRSPPSSGWPSSRCSCRRSWPTGLDGIYVGAGGVPDLDDMGALHGVQLPSGKATWDACAGAYGDRKIVVGTRPSPTPDVMCHEVGHALDDLDSPPGKWQSDSA